MEGILNLLTSVFVGIAVQTTTLFVFHKLRGKYPIMQPNVAHIDNTHPPYSGPFKELGILQKEIMILREKMEESGSTTARYVAKKHYKRKTHVPKSRSRSGQNPPLRYQKDATRVESLDERATPAQEGPSDVQACSRANSSTEPDAKIQDLERICYDLDAKMKHFKRKTLSNQLRIKDYAKGIKEYAESVQANQDELRHEVGSILFKLDDEMSLLDDDMQIRLSNVENRVFDLIQAKLKAERRKGWCRRSTRII
ncbi:hypothetical protein V8B55DRAFT_1451355 [Mucor lusitanicus]|uniref:Uncharacterized protein n=1 Tax=Mucor lusitanicus CBS 277.49 TaxID=747725 RepID=A0A168NIE7_MUCCL|nr:hypothetical protein MUCCIDRAFT_106879 [Mucor lusitanicus CBS 277.49]